MKDIISVSDFITRINIGLKKAKVKIIGEVAKVDIGPKGHVYFNLRDEKEQSIISCAIWKSRYDFFNIEMREGMKIIVSGNPEIYPLTGRFSFIATSIELTGEGLLKKEYEKLKKRLEEEGLFDSLRKRKIPDYVQKVGIITSLKGAVIADFSNNLGKYGFKIKIVDSRVEGQDAVIDIMKAINIFKKEEIDILIIMRGGGSLESLAPIMPFNNEFIIREIVNFPVPVITAIGHHKDTPLITLASDLSVSTPSIAATTISSSWEKLNLFLERSEREIIYNYENVINKEKDRIYKLEQFLKDYKNNVVLKYKDIEERFKESLFLFRNSLINFKIKLNSKAEKIFFNFSKEKEIIKEKIIKAESIVFSNDPKRQLNLGYSIARINGEIIKTVNNLKEEDIFGLEVKDGEIISKIKKINIKP